MELPAEMHAMLLQSPGLPVGSSFTAFANSFNRTGACESNRLWRMTDRSPYN
jgi:hypothetical protein